MLSFSMFTLWDTCMCEFKQGLAWMELRIQVLTGHSVGHQNGVPSYALGSRFYVLTGRGASWPSHPVSMRKLDGDGDGDGVGTLKSIHIGREEKRERKERKMKKEKSERKEEKEEK